MRKSKLPPYVKNAQKINHLSSDRIGYSIEEFADLIGIGRSAVYKALRSGMLPARKIGKRTIIMAEDVEKYLTRVPFWQKPIGPRHAR
jgi:excisionase family DNA binding protein